MNFKLFIDNAARGYIRNALRKNNGSPRHAAAWLGMPERTLWHWMYKLGIDREPAAIRASKTRRQAPPSEASDREPSTNQEQDNEGKTHG